MTERREEVATRDAAEAALMRRARDGDRGAFGELVRRHMRAAYYVALGLVGSHEDALDLSQDAFVRAFRARRRLDPARPFFPWLYQIVRRLCFNFLRDTRTRRTRMQEAGSWLTGETTGRTEPTDRRAERDELRRRLEEALATLSPAHREILVLREFRQLRYREIAELLQIPEGTVMSRLYSARRALAAALGENA